MVADLADEGFDRQVDLGVLAQVGLGGEPRPALRTDVRFGLVQAGVSSVPRLGGGEERDGSLLGRGVGTLSAAVAEADSAVRVGVTLAAGW